MSAAITKFINNSIAKVTILCFLFSLYTNFALSQQTVTDIDGNVYQTVEINGRVWTTTNYRVTRYVNGNCIPSGLTNSEWSTDTNGACATPATGNAELYGLLYNGYAVCNNANGGIAVPAGWRIATDEDWQELEAFLGMTTADVIFNGWRSSGSIGKKLKSTSTDWQAGGTNAGTNEVGFKALPAGTRAADGTLSYANQRAVFWTPSEDTDEAYRRVITYNQSNVHRTKLDKREGESVRLVKIPQEIVIDADSNIYQTININGTIWTTTNYRVKKYADGTAIPTGLSDTQWNTTTDGAYAASPTGNENTYGLLYNGYAVRNTVNGGIAIPAGWRIATDEDWQALEAYLGMTSTDITFVGWRSSGFIGKKLKSTTTDWQTGGTNSGTDEVGFKALPAGTRAADGTLSYANQRAVYWTPSADTDETYRRVITYDKSNVHRTNLDKREGESIRLVKIPKGTVSDENGNVYPTVDINGTVWMATNYRGTKYADGTAIPTGLSDSLWNTTTNGAYATPGISNASKYGLLYNGYAVRNTVNGGIAIPAGWRIATDEDWQELESYLGMTSSDLTLVGWRPSGFLGKKLKSKTVDWQTGGVNSGTDEVGFKALPAGTRAADGTLSYANQRAVYWTPSATSSHTYRRVITYNQSNVHRTNLDKREGESIRLVKIPEGNVIDVDGNVYQTVAINGVLWTLSNYRVTKYADGTAIPTGLSDTLWSTTTNGAYAKPATGSVGKYGLLYNGYAVSNTANGGISVPEGWRIATDEDWQAMEAFLGMTSSDLIFSGWRTSGSIGKKLKSKTADWQTGGANSGTDEVGFKALPAGTRTPNGTLSYANQRAVYWTPSGTTNETYRRVIGYDRIDLHRTKLNKLEGESIRLVKISTTSVQTQNSRDMNREKILIQPKDEGNKTNINVEETKTISVTVIPNPVTETSLKLMINGYKGNRLSARLIGLDSRIVQTWENIASDNNQNVYSLMLNSMPATGHYVLHVQDKGFSQFVKLIIQ